jgi:hypothetical protein
MVLSTSEERTWENVSPNTIFLAKCNETHFKNARGISVKIGAGPTKLLRW